MDHALSNKALSPLGFLLFMERDAGSRGGGKGARGMKGLNPVHDLCRAPKKKISHHPCFSGLSAEFKVSVK